MSQKVDFEVRVSGDKEPQSGPSYALDLYLQSEPTITERLLAGATITGIRDRVGKVKNEVDRLSDELSALSQNSSSSP
ncbi:hypothetical protein QBC46DRAFT_342685 [Diplogelasinospora grovesii]|uniref:Uncharacterized protein n=1 Tax=Diplogelasinospora grovesii TaxID=303347 RepID=A0AAN6N7P1_9PEZI|nr:hypothetical protein QBC46DRAFT_342685 [Diplogelasinospora grovesii]